MNISHKTDIKATLKNNYLALTCKNGISLISTNSLEIVSFFEISSDAVCSSLYWDGEYNFYIATINSAYLNGNIKQNKIEIIQSVYEMRKKEFQLLLTKVSEIPDSLVALKPGFLLYGVKRNLYLLSK